MIMLNDLFVSKTIVCYTHVGGRRKIYTYGKDLLYLSRQNVKKPLHPYYHDPRYGHI